VVSEKASRRLRIVVLGLCVLAGSFLATMLATVAAPGDDGSGWGVLLVLLVLHGASRRYPLQIVARGHTVEVPTSTVFGFALLLMAPAEVAVLGLALTALVPRRTTPSPRWLRPVIEVARTALVYGAAAGTLTWLTHHSGDVSLGEAVGTASSELLLIVLPAGFVAYCVDLIIVVGLGVVEHGRTPGAILRQNRGRHDLLVTLTLVALSPAVVVVSSHSLLLAPLLLLVTVALYHSTRVALVQRHAALHDGLTGLANRRHLDERLTSLMRADRYVDPFALIVMDLDRFKEVNDQLGHHVGDRLLAEVGRRFGRFEGLDLAARIGGDEFAFIVRRPLDDEQLLALGEALVREAGKQCEVAGLRLTVGASAGIARFPEHGTDGSALLRRADTAMYSAKRGGLVVSCAAVDERPLAGRVSLAARLEQAMERDELLLDYQPQVALVGGAVTGFEALLRWEHPEQGRILPSDFVSTVEHTDLIGTLTRHVLMKAIEDAARWHLAGYPVPVSVNISARDLLDRRLAGDLRDLLLHRGLDPSALTLEITETALQVDPVRAAQVLDELRHLGVRLSIDDFGTGYSSLGVLQELPVHELKIDRAFVARMHEPAGVSIARSIVGVAHALELTVVGEGVEDEVALQTLRTLGCDQVQGYFVCRPLRSEWVLPWLEDHAVPHTDGPRSRLRDLRLATPHTPA
jgi:diguanylate cyclase (GGDEF)-like protein